MTTSGCVRQPQAAGQAVAMEAMVTEVVVLEVEKARAHNGMMIETLVIKRRNSL